MAEKQQPYISLHLRCFQGTATEQCSSGSACQGSLASGPWLTLVEKCFLLYEWEICAHNQINFLTKYNNNKTQPKPHSHQVLSTKYNFIDCFIWVPLLISFLGSLALRISLNYGSKLLGLQTWKFPVVMPCFEFPTRQGHFIPDSWWPMHWGRRNWWWTHPPCIKMKCSY